MWCAALVGSVLQVTAPPPVAAEALPAAPAVWSFERVMERVREQGLGVQEARSRLERAKLGYEDARTAFYPALSVTGGVIAGTLEGRDPVDLSLSIRSTPILDGYEKFFAKQLAEIEVRYSRIAETQARELVASRARQAYLSLIAIARAHDQLTAAVGHAQRLVELAAAEAEPDMVAVRRLEGSLTLQRERMNLRSLERRRAEEELGLKTLLGLGPEEPFAVDADTPPAAVLPSAGEAPPAAENAAGARQELDLEAARRRLRASRFESFPQPSVRVGLTRGGVEVVSGAYVFAGVEIPLFDWGQRKRQRARAAVEVAERERELKRATLERQSELVRSELRRAALEQQGKDLLQYVELAERRLQAQLALYQSGRIAGAELARTQLEIAREKAEHALNEGSVWVLLCQREALLRVGVTSAP